MFRDTKDLNLEHEYNQRERATTRTLPVKGSFKEIEVGAGDKTFKQDRRGLWLGSKKMEEAPFSIDMDGLFKLLSKAGGGGGVGMHADKGIWVGAEEFEDAPFSIDTDGVFKIQGSGAGDKYIGIDVDKGIWLGAEVFEDAPFSVDMDGNMKIKASSATSDMSMEWEDADGKLGIYLGFEDV